MAVQLRQQRFHAGARAALERRSEWARLSRSGGPAVGEDPPVGQDQVRMVPSLLDFCALASGRDATAEPEDEDVLFGRDGAEPDLQADDDDDDDDNLAESWTVAQAQEARADVGRTDLDDVLAAAGRCDQEAAAAGEAGRAWTEARQQPPMSRAAAARKAPVRGKYT